MTHKKIKPKKDKSTHLLFPPQKNLSKDQEGVLNLYPLQKPCGTYLANDKVFKTFLMLHFIAMCFFSLLMNTMISIMYNV